MSVDLGDLVDPLKRTLNPPGQDLYAGVNDTQWVGRLTDAFWYARMNGFFIGYTADEDGVVTPIGGSSDAGNDLPRELQQVIILYAAYTAARWQLLNMRTSVKQQAGPVQQEVQRSAQLLVTFMNGLTEEIKTVRDQLALRRYTEATFLDMFVIRDTELRSGDQWWL